MLKSGNRNSSSTREDLAEEMSLHIQEKAEALEEEGLSRREALAAARKSFGNQALLQDRSYAVWESRFLGPLLADLRSAFLHLKRSPVLAATAVLIIAVGIGANTAIFNVLYSATLKSLPVKDAKDLVFLELAGPRINPAGMNLTPRLFTRLSGLQTAFTGLAARVSDRLTMQDRKNGNINLAAAFVTDNFFDLVGIDPLLGGTFTSGDSARVRASGFWPVVLSYRFWKQDFQGSPAAIGRKVRISNRDGIIVGVMPPSFDGLTPESPPDLFVPSGFLFDQTGNAAAPPIRGPGAPIVRVVGRLKPGVSLAQANESLADFNARQIGPAMAPYLQEQPYLKGARIRVMSASHGIRVLDSYRRVLLLLQILMAVALLLCSLNVTALQLALAYERSHEFALRVALGASRFHLTRQCLCEAFFLACAGAVLSVPIPLLSAGLLPHYLTRPGSADAPLLPLDWMTFAAAGGFVLVVTILVGIIPSLLAGRIQPAAVLKARSALGRPPFLLGRVLVALQIALAFVLVSAAALFAGKDHHLHGEDLGFNPEHVVEVTAQFQWLPLTNLQAMDLYRKMLHRLSAEKGIQAASLTWITPLTGEGYEMEVHGDSSARSLHEHFHSSPLQESGRIRSFLSRKAAHNRSSKAPTESENAHVVAFNQIGPGYFSTLQTNLLEGREFSDEDDDRSHCVLNRLAAKLLFPGRESIGQEVIGRKDSEFPISCKVIGVVEDAKYADVHAAAMPTLYVPITAASLTKGGYRNNMVFLLRAKDDRSIVSAYRQVLHALAPGTSYMRFLPMRIQVEQALGRDQLLSLASSLFAAIALLLCGASVLSLLGIRVKQNATDIAIRIALGATPLRIVRSILQESLALFACGAVLGVAVLASGSYLLRSYLNAPAVHDTFAVLCAICLLAGVSLCAGGLPAIQAVRLKPRSLLYRDS